MFKKELCVLLGLERHGIYSDLFNLCAGGMDKKDNGCFLQNAQRELKEEFKIKCNKLWEDCNDKTDNTEVYESEDYICFLFNATPVFIIGISNISTELINKKIEKCNCNRDLSWSEREMYKVEYFSLKNLKLIILGYYKGIEYRDASLSKFATGVIQHVLTHF